MIVFFLRAIIEMFRCKVLLKYSKLSLIFSKILHNYLITLSYPVLNQSNINIKLIYFLLFYIEEN